MLLTFLCIFIFISALVSLAIIHKSTSKTFNKLEALKQKAQTAETLDELKSAWNELIAVNKECWHRNFVPLVVEIRAIIKTKHKHLTQ